MASAKITLIGMYNYDDTLFNDLALPDGIDKDEFVSSLLIEAGEFEVLYPDMDFLKLSIKLWGLKWNRTFAEWLRGTKTTWNPIENYDRMEDTVEVLKTTRNLTDTRKPDLKNKNIYASDDTTETLKSGENELKVSAFDSGTYSNKELNIIDGGKSKLSRGGNDTVETTGSDTMEHTGTNKDRRTIKGRIHGNIGVTQSADMLRNFYNIAEWNLINHMIDVFKSELLICIY